MSILSFMILFCVSLSTIAQTRKSAPSRSNAASPGYVGLGILSYEAGSAATSATSSSKSLFGQNFYQLHISKLYSWNNKKIAPLFQYGMIANKSPEGHQKTNVSSLGGRILFYPFSSSPQWDLHTGAGLMAYRIQGKSGTVTLSNGNSTADFGTNSDTQSSTLIYLDLGAGYSSDKNRFDFAVFTTKISDNDKRAYSLSLSYSREVF